MAHFFFLANRNANGRKYWNILPKTRTGSIFLPKNLRESKRRRNFAAQKQKRHLKPMHKKTP